MKTIPLVALALVCVGTVPRAQASAIDGFRIVGDWSNPVLAGYGIDGATRAVSYVDHTHDAVYSIDNATSPSAASVITSGRPVSKSATTNVISFTGGVIPSDHSSDPFSIGSISFLNGDVTRVIFGATLNLFATNGAGADISLGSIQVAFNSTNNTGTRTQDADYLTFGGLAGSFEAYEGETVSGQLKGLVIGDPYVKLTGLALDAGQSNNGFIGDDPGVAINGLSSVPLPASAPMFGAALLGLAGLGYAAKRKKAAAAA